MILAPLAREKKGEFTGRLRRHAGAGLCALSCRRRGLQLRRTCPTLKKTEKHDIDVVIDRLKVRGPTMPERAALRQRLAESFEAALRLADGRAIALEMDTERRTPVQRQVRLPGVPLLDQRAGAAPVLLQLAAGRLPDLRRHRPAGVLRPGARGGLPHAQPGQWRHQGLGPAQWLLLRHAGEPGQTLQVRHRRPVRIAAAGRAAGHPATARARRRSSSAT